jgi:steroid delta-isomerase
MPTPEQMRDAVLAYFACFASADVEAIVGLFAEDAVVEDPVDGARIVGRDAIRAFFTSGFAFVGGAYRFEPEGAVRIAGRHAACAAIAICDKADPPFRLETIDVMTFDESGKFAGMKAYWSPVNMRSLSGDDPGAAASRVQNFMQSLGG